MESGEFPLSISGGRKLSMTGWFEFSSLILGSAHLDGARWLLFKSFVSTHQLRLELCISNRAVPTLRASAWDLHNAAPETSVDFFRWSSPGSGSAGNSSRLN